MRSLPKPTDEKGNIFSAQDVFKLCISKVRNNDLKHRLESIVDFIANSAEEYNFAASKTEIHTIDRCDNVANVVTNDEMVAVYTLRLVPKNAPGRAVYSRILAAAPQGRCPLCDVGVVSTLDHHLLKTEYSALTVTPNNLVPACTWCQGAKWNFYPTTEEEQTLHPYFDDFESECWLRADIVEGSPATFLYSVDAPPDWNKAKISRTQQHLKIFKLHSLYTSNAAVELVNIRHRLGILFEKGGAALVRIHLQEEEASRRDAKLNSWQTAFYAAAQRSDWFCNGGFEV